MLANGLIDGGVFSVGFLLIIIMILCYNPRLELRHYPPALQAVALPPTHSEKKEFKRIALFSLTLLLVFLFTILRNRFSPAEADLSGLVLHIFIMLMVLNVADLIILDWLLFVRITPKFIVIPNTEGHPAYGDFNHHIAGFVKGCIFSAIGAILLGFVVYGGFHWL